MANKIVLKKSSVAAKVPLATDLEIGELAVNLADAKLYSKDASGTVIQLGGGGGSGDVVGPSSATDNAIPRYDGATGKLIQNSGVTIDDSDNLLNPRSIKLSGSVPAAPTPGTLWFDSTTDTLNLQQNAITQQVGEELFVYGKASAAISGETILQAIYKTGTVGASGVIQFAPTVSGITDGGSIIGVATENIATNGFGRVTNFGIVHGINTTGSTYGETWADGDDIWYNPVTGGLTKTKPVAPNIKVQIGTIIHAGTGGSGSFQVLLNTGSVLGGTDSNVQITSPTSGNALIYDATAGYWKNANVTAGTGIGVTNGAGSITISNSGVTSVGATAPIQSSGGATPTISITQASGTTNGYLSSTDWNTFNNKTSNTGTVTSIGGTGTVSGLTLSGTVTTSGNLTLGGTLAVTPSNFASQTANTILAAPNGAAGVPTFRALVAADVPTLNQNTTGTASNVTGTVAIANGGTGATTASAALTALGAQPASTAITTSNIGSQSVNYATSAGSATSATSATTATTATNQSGGTVNATSILSAQGVSDTYSGLRLVNPGGGALTTSSGAITGAIKIKLPTATLNSSTMIRFTVKIYEYNTGYSRTIEIGGYNYVGGNWYNWFATESSQSGGDINVRFGQDASSDCIWIGDTTTVWQYPQVFVTDVQCGFSNTSQAMWASGWAVSFVTSFDTVEQTTVAYRLLASNNYNNYAPTLTGTGASGTWGINVSGNAATATTATTATNWAGIPAGTIMLFRQTAAPTGWTKDTTNYDGSAMRVVTGSVSSGGTVAFTTAFASQAVSGSISGGSVAATTLTTAQLASHNHNQPWGEVGGSPTVLAAQGGGVGAGANANVWTASVYTGTTMSTAGSGSSHTHSFTQPTFSGTAINLAVKYCDVIFATKN